MKSIVEKLITALENTDAELSRLRKDRRDSWSNDPINELVAEARAALDAPVSQDEWLVEAVRRIAELADLRGQLPHTAWKNKLSHLITQRKQELLTHLRARPAPEGMVLVPIEPTDEMSDSAWRGFQDADFSYLRSKLSLHDVRRVFVMFYKAMIAATERNKP